ncbi:MAG TPA: phosphate acyltransferase PlsX [Phycisphaerales bacterium]|nr:phosphate acyltransferase PlsX [Phycisphaerales bacterium]
MRLAIDVMGGDHAPDAILKGCVEGLVHLGPDDRLVLVGRERDINEVLGEMGAGDSRLEVHHTDEVIGMCEPPAKAVRSKPNSSIVQMCRLASKRVDDAVRCDAALSAGNTGACVSAGVMQMKRLKGVHRPGISVAMPGYHGPIVLCDAGANPEPTAQHLWQYAIMAEAFSRLVLGIEHPRVAIMNIGAEDSKGTETIRTARDLIKATPEMNYIGFIEGREFFEGVADVVVTDGLMGNVVLKTAEGMAKSLFKAISKEIMELDPELMGRFAPVAKAIWAKNDYHEYGGAPLMGVNGCLFIAHGSSEPRTIANAIRSCRDYVAADVNSGIVERIAQAEAAVSPERALT